MKRFRYIVGVGLVKTGTTSLSKALTKVNYKVIDSKLENSSVVDNIVKNRIKANKKNVLRDLPFNAFNDVNFCRKHYKYIMENCIDVGFIVTYRNFEDRFRSARRYYNKPVEREEFLHWHLKYYVPLLNLAEFDDRFLVMDVCNGDGWEKLCRFLNIEVPTCKFPHINKFQKQ